MSYSFRSALGALTASDAYASGSQVVGGFSVTGLASKDSASAVQKLREAVAANFPSGNLVNVGGRNAVNWGPAFGVPSGRLYAVVTLSRDGVTGGEINNAFAAVASDLARRLGGLTVALTNVHTTGGATPLTALTPDAPSVPGATLPSTSMSPVAIAGIAGLLLIPVAGLAFVLLRRPVVRNRRRRR